MWADSRVWTGQLGPEWLHVSAQLNLSEQFIIIIIIIIMFSLEPKHCLPTADSR